MIKSIDLRNYGPIEAITWNGLNNINLLIGENGTGKTIALKALFSAVKCLEEANMGDDNRSVSDILSDKLYWTFQTNGNGLGSLVNDRTGAPLAFSMTDADHRFAYTFGVDTKKKVGSVDNNFPIPRNEKAVFIPSKEVLSLYQIILKTREVDRVFGFDETEYSLVKAMQYPVPQDSDNLILNAAEILQRFDDGSLEYDTDSDKWVFKRGKKRLPIGILSEGVRKMSVVEKLLKSNYIKPGSIVMIDEIESSLHPQALVSFIDVIYELSKCGIQFFISTHSYITVKKMYVLAREKKISIPTISLKKKGQIEYSDLQTGAPDNEIIDVAREIYEKEVDVILGDEE